MLRRRDKGTGNIDFVDISSAEYIPAENAGISYEQVRSPGWIQASLLTPFTVCIMKSDVPM